MHEAVMWRSLGSTCMLRVAHLMHYVWPRRQNYSMMRRYYSMMRRSRSHKKKQCLLLIKFTERLGSLCTLKPYPLLS